MSTLDQKTFDRNVKISTNVNDSWQVSEKVKVSGLPFETMISSSNA